VTQSPTDPHTASPAELQERLAADRAGDPYLLFYDGEGSQRIFSLADAPQRLTIGRAPGCELPITWDEGVSRAHAQLERLGQTDWAAVDDGLSRNGSFLNGERLRQRRRLADGDVLRLGDTTIVFRAPLGEVGETIPATREQEVQLSPAQRRVLVALCRPFRDGGDFATPASNQAIADELVVSVEAVKTHMRALFERFEVGDLPRQAKRSELVRRAFQNGAVSVKDL
jgi:pSer/pThr/pTyr-binding forkhead associated (FHA) protein